MCIVGIECCSGGGVLFSVSTDDTCVVGRVLCAVCTLCSVFTLFSAVIEFTVFAVIIFTLWWVGLCTVVLTLFGGWVGFVMWVGGWGVGALEGCFVL